MGETNYTLGWRQWIYECLLNALVAQYNRDREVDASQTLLDGAKRITHACDSQLLIEQADYTSVDDTATTNTAYTSPELPCHEVDSGLGLYAPNEKCRSRFGNKNEGWVVLLGLLLMMGAYNLSTLFGDASRNPDVRWNTGGRVHGDLNLGAVFLESSFGTNVTCGISVLSHMESHSWRTVPDEISAFPLRDDNVENDEEKLRSPTFQEHESLHWTSGLRHCG
uniref:Uncharacterized protein n=1 Tax=Octactis speculum TaxID=3111310 RepID=A0A7S2MJJ8_9STRA|mmetsp:Transcript_63703/g.87552  ORF Transcript_63703/g.87552 Transcript_63703/m.87552 type:complete len:223 (+) Transcript_63703:503-1171(+)